MMKSLKVLTGTLIIAGVLTAGAVSFAEDPLSTTSKNIMETVQTNNQLVSHAIVDVDGEKITNVDLLNYKAYKSIENTQVSDQELLENMITEKLYLQLAKEKNVYATLEDGKKMAEENRQILDSQPKEVKETQQKMIEMMGLTEDQYWNDFAPVEYQKIISAQNLSALLEQQKVLHYNVEDINDYGLELQQFKHELYEQAKGNKVKILDDSMSLQ